jgi:hypothetical protein
MAWCLLKAQGQLCLLPVPSFIPTRWLYFLVAGTTVPGPAITLLSKVIVYKHQDMRGVV